MADEGKLLCGGSHIFMSLLLYHFRVSIIDSINIKAGVKCDSFILHIPVRSVVIIKVDKHQYVSIKQIQGL
jgi:hypothetical protein